MSQFKTREELYKVLNHIYHSVWEYFDYPSYGGLPESVSYGLSSEFVDAVQDFYRFRDTMVFAEWARALTWQMAHIGADELPPGKDPS